MKSKRLIKVFFVLSAASLLLPWFTYNARVMGYCWGFSFAKWFALPMILIGVSLVTKPESKGAAIAGELSAIVNLILCVLAFGRWQVFANITAGFRWADGLRTAQPGFWIAAACFILLFIAFSCEFGKRLFSKAENQTVS